MRLNEKTVRGTEPDPARNRIFYDDDVRGFGLRVTRAGAKSFVLNYRVGGRERRLTIGPWPTWSAAAARRRAIELRRQIDLGSDPLAEREAARKDPTFGELVEEYFQTEARNHKGRAEYERLLRRDALPKWRNVRAADIRRRDVIALIEQRAQQAPIAANRLFELIRRIFNFAVRRDILESSPCLLIRKPGVERSKDRVLNAEEIRRLWAALDSGEFTNTTAAALRLILLTGQRPGEVVGAAWAEMDLAEGWWTIPAEKAKNGLAHRVPLTETVKRMLEALPAASEYVFPSPTGRGGVHRNARAKAIRRARRQGGPLAEVEPFSPHDLRRTAASLMASAGVERFVVGRVLNHVERDVTKVYDRYGYDREKRRALETLDRKLKAIRRGGQAGERVIEFPA